MMTDESARAGIQEKARALFRVTETILTIALLITLLWLVNARFGVNFMALEPLRDASVAFDQAAADWNAERARDIALLPPPQDSTKLPEWADLVQAHLGYPAAVYLLRGTTVQPVRVPPDLKDAVSNLPQFRDTTHADIAGNVAIRQGPLGNREIAAFVFDAGPDRAQWGVISRLGDYLPEFTREALSWKRTPATGRVSMIVAVDNRTLPGMRAFFKDAPVGTTPALDTTNIHYAITRGDFREEYYLPIAQQILADHVRKPWFPWFLIVVDIVLMAVVYAFHRWIRGLTAAKPL